MSPLEQLAHSVMDEIDDMLATVSRFALAEQSGAVEKLPGILAKAMALAGELNDLCNAEHAPPSMFARGLVSSIELVHGAAFGALFLLSGVSRRSCRCRTAPRIRAPVEWPRSCNRSRYSGPRYLYSGRSSL